MKNLFLVTIGILFLIQNDAHASSAGTTQLEIRFVIHESVAQKISETRLKLDISNLISTSPCYTRGKQSYSTYQYQGTQPRLTIGKLVYRLIPDNIKVVFKGHGCNLDLEDVVELFLDYERLEQIDPFSKISIRLNNYPSGINNGKHGHISQASTFNKVEYYFAHYGWP